jgi:hypothetical protein
MFLGSPTGAQWTVKNESHRCTKKNTLFYSEFDADSEYVTLFENYFGQKNALIDTCPFLNLDLMTTITLKLKINITTRLSVADYPYLDPS